MSRSASARFDGRGWRADVVDRLDRRSLGVAAAWVAVTAALKFVGSSDAGAFASYTLFKLGIVMITLVIVAIALVAVARRKSPWVAYPAAAIATAVTGSVLGLVFDPWGWQATTPTPSLRSMVLGHLYFLAILFPFAVLYVYASRATHDEKMLRRVEAERVAEAERLAQRRLQTELATVDHDLVLTALRMALSAPERSAGQAENLLHAVTDYLRVAQQRDASEPGRIAAALEQLRGACAGRGDEPAQHATA